jgi:hypothetical protein
MILITATMVRIDLHIHYGNRASTVSGANGMPHLPESILNLKPAKQTRATSCFIHLKMPKAACKRLSFILLQTAADSKLGW